MSKPLVSVIVPTKNSAEFLDACLSSIKEQTYSPIEVIVVDNSSSDTTLDIAKKYTDRVFNQGPERSAQRNFGAGQSTGEFVLFIDSDMELSKNVVKSCIEQMNNPNVAGVIIPEESFGMGFWAQCKKLERSFYIGVDAVEAARFFSMQVFNKVDGYNEQLISGEDWDLSDRIEQMGNLARIKDFIYHNEGKISLSKTLKKKYYYARQAKAYIHQTKNSLGSKKRKAGIIGRYVLFLSQPVKLLKNPFTGIGMLFMKTAEFVFGAIGYLNA